MSQRDRDVLKVMSLVLKGQRTQVEAARLLKLGVRQVRRIQHRLKSSGDGAVVHRLRGRPSNRRIDDAVKRKALLLYRQKYLGFGPTLAAEKLAEEDRVKVAVRTLGEWLLAAGLWTRHRRRDRHRSRRMRRACFGEMVQADASLHDWLEGRGQGLKLTLVGMIDDATGKMLCRFYPSETSEAYMDLLSRWIASHGRPLSWYSDRHGIFRAESRLLGEDEPVAVATQFSRALAELEVELILANSPQAKGRIERLWGTAQDRLVKELRPPGAGQGTGSAGHSLSSGNAHRGQRLHDPPGQADLSAPAPGVAGPARWASRRGKTPGRIDEDSLQAAVSGVPADPSQRTGCARR